MIKKLLVNSSAFVVGGRCNLERYKETRVTNLVDIDITSCYGSSIAQLSYPVSTPFVYAVSVNEKGLTLKDFFSVYKDELIPNLYSITVSGSLTFEQDLIYSKFIANCCHQKRTIRGKKRC